MRKSVLVLLVGFVVVASGCVSESSNPPENLSNDSADKLAGNNSTVSGEPDSTDDVSEESSSDDSDSEEDRSSYTSDIDFRVDEIEAVSETSPNGYGFDTFIGQNFTVRVTVTNVDNESGRFTEILAGKPDDITSDIDHVFKVATEPIEVNETVSFNKSIRMNRTERHEIFFPAYPTSPDIVLDVGREKLDYNEPLKFEGFRVQPGEIRQTDELKVEVNESETVENTTENKRFVLIELEFQNNGEENVDLPGRNMISLELDRFYDLENTNVSNYQIYSGGTLEPGESYSGYTLFKTFDDTTTPPELEYRHNSLRIGADWNITREQWPEEMLRTQ